MEGFPNFFSYFVLTRRRLTTDSHRILNLQSTEAAVSAALADWGPAGQMPEGLVKATESRWSFMVG